MLERIIVAYEKTMTVTTIVPAIIIQGTTYIFVDGQFKCKTLWTEDWQECSLSIPTIVNSRTVDENIELFRGLTWLLEQAKEQETAE